VIFREYFNGAYSLSAYYLAKQLMDMPLFLIAPLFLNSIAYWMANFNDEVARFFISCGILIVLTQVVMGFGKLFIHYTSANY